MKYFVNVAYSHREGFKVVYDDYYYLLDVKSVDDVYKYVGRLVLEGYERPYRISYTCYSDHLYKKLRSQNATICDEYGIIIKELI